MSRYSTGRRQLVNGLLKERPVPAPPPPTDPPPTHTFPPAALFNRIAGSAVAIVYDYPGVTRDRSAAELDVSSGARPSSCWSAPGPLYCCF